MPEDFEEKYKSDSGRAADSQEPADPEYEYANEKQSVRSGYYGTGSTTPPRDHAAVVAVVLVLIVLAAGVISAMRLMDIHPFKGRQIPEESVPTVLVGDAGGRQTQSLETEPEAVQEPQNSAIRATESWDTKLEIQQGRPGAPNAAAVEGALSWQEVYEKVIPSVVSIVSTNGSATSSGTGVIMNGDGYLLTNAHVVEGGTDLQVILSDDRSFEAVLMGMDRISDLAVLHIDADGLTPAEFGDSSVLRVGDAVVAIGDPLGVELRGTMTDGMISAINRNIRSHGRTMTLIQTTAALNAGNSGGPLVNCFGQVVGINTLKISDYAARGGVEGLGFAIPITTAKQVVEELIVRGYVSGRPELGLSGSMLSSFYQYYYRLPRGMLIEQVDPASHAAQQGIAPGDILIAVDGQRIESTDQLQQLISSHEVGEEVEATIYRDGRQWQVRVRLGEDKGT